MRYALVITMTATMLLCGCTESVDQSLFNQIKELEETNTKLTIDNETLTEENAELTDQVETLTSLGPKVRLDVLGRVQSISLSKRTGLYDKDQDPAGDKETLVVYMQTIDDAGDAIKAAGSVDVELWNLEAENEAKLAEWDISPEELKKLWSSTVMTSYFRLKFDVSNLPVEAAKGGLTVKVKFTDYITGDILRKQMVIMP